ncbi:MAG: phosphopentomutase [Rhodothermales bacterium]|nr:phosphopentomutase [Rhodothermales bacterium]MBO6778402.1 phosphopentomutase [Rhodothermales bacterium]
MSRPGLFVTIVLDGVGIGWQPDAAAYGDEGANTLAHVLEAAAPQLPNLQAAGLGNIAPLPGMPADANPQAAWARMEEQSAGKDSTTGHWELAGLRLEKPFPTYPDGFPENLLDRFRRATGVPQVLGNEVASGTDIIARLGAEHLETGSPIVYTSADSVFQIAAHTDVVSLDQLYAWCALSREEVCIADHAVGRVIARPFTGTPGDFTRLSDQRKDYAMPPPEGTVQARLQDLGVRTVSIGKVADLFAGAGFDETHKTGRNPIGIRTLLNRLNAWDGAPTFIWVNLIDFDQEFGHRNNPAGFAAALEEFDAALPHITQALPSGAGLFVTADHGNDPTYPGTDHTREYVPVLLWGTRARAMGSRPSFNDHAATVLDWFAHPEPGPGVSMLDD